MQLQYKPRRFDQSPLFQVVYHYFDELQYSYYREYSEKYGQLRPIITHTVNRYLLCGDPREGVARYECPNCTQSLTVPFSCKTRLFCPSCHEKKIILWVDEIHNDLLLPVEHRFWTFSIPKRLRPYFLRDRKLLALLVKAANHTICKAVGKGRLQKGARPGIISLIQTHSDSLDWNAHLHLIVTNGAVDYSDPLKPKFKPCRYWNTEVMTEIFRLELISMLVKKKALLPDIADNLLSWKNSGFHVYASWPFHPEEGDTLKNRLAYAFRPAVVLKRLKFDGEEVAYRSKKNVALTFTPTEFLAKLTLHIPDRYQNIRRYAGFYASNIQRKVRAARKADDSSLAIQETKPIKPKWAVLIAKIFGKLPTECPKCGAVMELKQFILENEVIQKLVPELSRAPPKLQFEHYRPSETERVYGLEEGEALELYKVLNPYQILDLNCINQAKTYIIDIQSIDRAPFYLLYNFIIFRKFLLERNNND
ncbi:MAG: transposase [Pseudomonadota bacterium]